ncbi:glutathione S-transferase [Brevundimonas sp.]|uniref:glutathione S-transferase n=1 Tax=Brevundimonas sp. TaxID=1871086 RepID=UPI002EDA74EC
MELIVAPRLYSTWSLRPWLVLRRCGADFTTTEIDVYSEAGQAEIARLSPSRLAPLLRVEGETIWDSMAICVWAAERYPEARLWPADAHARWLARSAVCEMHSGFNALRTHCAMGPDHSMVGPDRSDLPGDAGVAQDIRRLVALFMEMRARFGAGGPWLFGEWSIPDAFFTPVATRFRHYQVDLSDFGDDGAAQAYCDALLAQPDFLEWSASALR